jgi:hypothetical protein
MFAKDFLHHIQHLAIGPITDRVDAQLIVMLKGQLSRLAQVVLQPTVASIRDRCVAVGASTYPGFEALDEFRPTRKKPPLARLLEPGAQVDKTVRG